MKPNLTFELKFLILSEGECGVKGNTKNDNRTGNGNRRIKYKYNNLIFQRNFQRAAFYTC